MNINNNKIDSFFYSHKCTYFIQKNGKIKYIPNDYKRVLCCLLKNKNTELEDTFLKLEGHKVNIIIKLLLFRFCQIKNINYILYQKENQLIIFHNNTKNIKSILNYLFFKKYYSKKINNIYINKYISFKYLIKNLNKTDMITNIFYQNFIYKIKSELKEKYNVMLTDFDNYMELYTFLEKKGYVKFYYEKEVSYILRESKKIYEKVLSDPRLEEFHRKNMYKIMKFQNIDLMEKLEKAVPDKLNRQYIKNKFMELQKKYNLK
jgi:hypothetical protein